MKENLHAGHRQRVRSRYLQDGGEGFLPHQLLELLLFSCIPMRDTNELAHRLLREFGSLSLLIEADPQDIMRRGGVSENTAIFLSAQNVLVHHCLQDKWKERPALNTSEAAGDFVISLLSQASYERFYVICLDNRSRLVHAALVAEGTVGEAVVYPRLVVEAALRHKAASVILAHNHPGGSLRPSLADVQLTSRLMSVLGAIDILVADHIIAAGGAYFSFAEKGLLGTEKTEK